MSFIWEDGRPTWNHPLTKRLFLPHSLCLCHVLSRSHSWHRLCSLVLHLIPSRVYLAFFSFPVYLNFSLSLSLTLCLPIFNSHFLLNVFTCLSLFSPPSGFVILPSMCLYLSLGQKHLHVKLTLSVPSRRLLSFPTYEAVLIACLRLVTTPPRAFLWVSGASFHLGRWSLVRLSNPPPSLSMLSVFRRRGSWSPASCNPSAVPRLPARTVPE